MIVQLLSSKSPIILLMQPVLKVTCSIVNGWNKFSNTTSNIFLDLQFGSSSNLTDDFEINESGVKQNHPYPGSTCGQDLELEFDYY